MLLSVMPLELQIALLIAVPTGVWIAILRMPYWFARSLHRHRMWRLRDAVADDMIDGRLPKDHPAVRELLRRTELAISELQSITAVTFYVFARVRRRSDRGVFDRMRAKRASLDGLTGEQRARLEAHHECLSYLCASTVLTGTWVGIATILRFLIPAMRDASHQNRRDDVKATLWLATSKATSGTRLGQCSGEYIARDLDSRLAGVS